MLTDALRRHAIVLLVIVAALTVLVPYTPGDAPYYVADVVNVRAGTAGPDLLWEFGHVLWRPAGFLALALLKAISPSGFGFSDSVLLTRAYIFVNMLACAGLGILFHSLARRAGAPRYAALGITLVFTLSHAVLNYAMSGTSYVTGLFLVALAVWLLQHRRTVASATGAGLALATAVLVWLPFLFVIPAALLTPVLLDAPERWWRKPDVLRLPFLGGVVAALTIGAVYAVVIFIVLDIRSLHDALAWIGKASHQIKPGFSTAIRVVFGIPRSFIEMGDFGKMIKRLMYRDPYTPTSVKDILMTAAPPLALFYVTVASLIVAGWRTPAGRKAVLLFAVAFVPMLFFATVLFEGGSMERFFPVYPFAVLMAACALQCPGAHRWLAAVLLIVIAVRTAVVLSPARAQEVQVREAQRIESFRSELGAGFLAVMTIQDPMLQFSTNYIYNPLNRPKPVPVYRVYDSAQQWKEAFARKAVKSWKDSGQVWVSRRLVADRPLPEWEWVEGEDRRLPWQAGVQFFRSLRYEREAGGPDGFLMLPPSPDNWRQLTQIASTLTDSESTTRMEK